MDSVKVKNFIILVLLIVNAILLSVFVSDAVREGARSGAAVDGAVALLAENGIQVSEDVDLGERSLPLMTITRDAAREAQMAGAVLGDASITDAGGNILLYFGSRGEASFRGTGGLEMNIHSGEYVSRDVLDLARSFAADMGLETVEDPVGWNMDSSTLQGTLELCCSYEGVPVENCVLSFTFAGGDLLGVYGTRVLDSAEPAQSESSVDVPTVLMRFLQLVLDGGHVCSSLESLELCYNMRANAAGEGQLIPIWRIETDTGSFFINALTGLEETIT